MPREFGMYPQRRNRRMCCQEHSDIGLTRQSDTRQGAMLLEAIVSAALLATLLVIINQIAVRLHAQTALIDRHYVAQQTLENLLEELTSRNWDDLHSTAINELEIPAWVRSKLPQATLIGEVIQETDPTTAKRITLRLGWQEASGTQRRPPANTTPALTTWVYQRLDRK